MEVNKEIWLKYLVDSANKDKLILDGERTKM